MEEGLGELPCGTCHGESVIRITGELAVPHPQPKESCRWKHHPRSSKGKSPGSTEDLCQQLVKHCNVSVSHFLIHSVSPSFFATHSLLQLFSPVSCYLPVFSLPSSLLLFFCLPAKESLTAGAPPLLQAHIDSHSIAAAISFP